MGLVEVLPLRRSQWCHGELWSMDGTTKLFHHVYPISVSNWIQPTTENGAYPPEIESFDHLSQFSREEHNRELIAAHK